MKCKTLFVALTLLLSDTIWAASAKKLSQPLHPVLECKMSKVWNGKNTLKIDPQIGALRFEIPYSTMDCAAQTYELKVKGDTLIIVQHDSLETCMKHKVGYFLVGKIENLKKGIYYVNVAQSIGTGIRYSLIKSPIKIEIP